MFLTMPLRSVRVLFLAASVLAAGSIPAQAGWTDCATDPPERAIDSCSEMLALYPDAGTYWALALRKRSEAHFQLKAYDKAIDDLDRLIAGGYGLAEDWGRRSDSQAWLDNWDEALGDAERAVSLDPADDTLRWSLAIAETETRRHAEAIKHLTELTEAYPKDEAVWGKLAWNHFKLGQYETALGIYAKAIGLKDDDADLWVQRGMTEDALGRSQEAEKSFSAALRHAPRNADALYWRARVRQDLGDLDGAIEDISMAVAIDPAPLFRMRRVYINIARGEIDAADRELDGVWAEETNESDKHYLKGRIQAARGEHAAAVVSFDAAVAADKDATLSIYEGAMSLRALGQNEKAEQRFSDVLKRWPEDSYTYYMRSAVRLDLGDADGALEDANAAIRFDPDSSEAYRRRAQVYAQKMLYARSEADCRMALEIDPDNVDAHQECAWAAWALDALDRALADYDALLARYPFDVALIGERAELLYEIGRRDEALSEAERAVKMQPMSSAALRHRGAVFDQDGRYRSAFADYSRAIGADPQDGWSYQLRAGWYLEQGLFAQGLADCETMAEKLPEAPASYRCLARAAWAAGDAEQTLKWLDKALSLNANYGAAHYDRAVVASRRGDRQEAIGHLDRTVALNYRVADSLLMRGDLRADLGQPGPALDDYRKAEALLSGELRDTAMRRITGLAEELRDKAGRESLAHSRRARHGGL